uniref:Uncharacterized protein n=1 Tax=Eptatretus burgeri TaxID=7764 RepID=A0A8C4Q4Y8_EPTBU
MHSIVSSLPPVSTCFALISIISIFTSSTSSFTFVNSQCAPCISPSNVTVFVSICAFNSRSFVPIVCVTSSTLFVSPSCTILHSFLIAVISLFDSFWAALRSFIAPVFFFYSFNSFCTNISPSISFVMFPISPISLASRSLSSSWTPILHSLTSSRTATISLPITSLISLFISSPITSILLLTVSILWWDNSFCSGMNPPRSTTPEHYLTPLQQKEVVIEHLRSCLGDAEWQRDEREVMSLKQQMERMREDWVEEECHRVEAQLALQQARREIQRLHDALETVQGCLQEKDQGIWRCFADITEQNRKLEVLLNDIEIAEYCVAKVCAPPSALLVDKILLCADCDVFFVPLDFQLLFIAENILFPFAFFVRGSCGCKHVGVQADVVTCEVLRVSGSCIEAEQPVMEESDQGASSRGDADGDTSPPAQRPRPRKLLDLSPSDPCTLLLLSEQYARAAASASRSSLCPCIGLSPAVANRVGPTTVAKALAATVEYREAQQIEPETFWSRYALLDWLALAVPALPTVAWLICRQRAPVEPEPLYNMATVLRGCCLLALPALRVAVRRVRSGKAGH